MSPSILKALGLDQSFAAAGEMLQTLCATQAETAAAVARIEQQLAVLTAQAQAKQSAQVENQNAK